MYPVMLRLENRICVIVGGGAVAARKAADLLASGARVTVISPVLHASLEALTQHAALTIICEPYKSDQLMHLSPLLVFAATDDPTVNAQVAADAHRIGALVNISGDSATSDFFSMAQVRRGDITAAISTGGASPALSAHLRTVLSTVLEQAIGDEYATLSAWMRESRAAIRQTISTQPERRDLWQAVIDSDILQHLRDGDAERARRLYEQLLGESVNPDEH